MAPAGRLIPNVFTLIYLNICICISLRKSFRKSQNSQSTQHSRPQLVLIRLLNSMKYAFIKILSFSPRSHTHINDLHFAAFRRTCMHTEINFMPLHSAACTCIQKQISCHRFRCTHIHTKRKFISYATAWLLYRQSYPFPSNNST